MTVPVFQWPDKDPDEILDYEIDWTSRLAGDTITASTWTIGPDTVLVKNSDIRNTTNTVIWLAGGTIGKTYTVTNEITTAAGRTMDQTVRLQITQK